MQRTPRHGWALGICLAGALGAAAAPSAPQAGAAVAPDAAAFDEALRLLARDGLGLEPDSAERRLDELEALLPPGDSARRQAFEAIGCAAPTRDIRSARAKGAALLAGLDGKGDSASLARLHLCQAALAPAHGDQSKSMAHIDTALELARRSGDPVLVGDVLTVRADAHSLAGRHAKGLIDFVDAQQLFESADDEFRAQRNLQSVGIVYRRMGEFPKAREHLERSLEASIATANWDQQFIALLQLGFLYDDWRKPGTAKGMFERAAGLARERNFDADEGFALLGQAGAEVNLGQGEDALSTLRRARTVFARAGSEGDEPMVRLLEGQALYQLGKPLEALPMLDAAADAWQPTGNERYLMLALASRSAAREATGDATGALADLRRQWQLHLDDDRERAEQRAEFLRFQFDVARRDAENEELRGNEVLRKRELEAMSAARRWQWVAIGLGSLLLLGLLVAMARQIAKARRLRLLAMTDPLTGLANRRQTDYRGTVAFKAARVSGQPFCVLAIDIDHFKQVNDTYGHAVGDAVLQRVGRECQRTLRKLDLMGRIGGEEFTGLLPETAEPAACLVAERLRTGVEGLDLHDVAPGLRVTISLGVAQMRGEDGDFAALLARADAAMYRAKQSGRNRVVSDEAS